MEKILIYSHDTFGLGNIGRMLAIAKYLSTGWDSILILTDSPMLHAFRIEPGIDYVKLPGLGRDNEGGHQLRALEMDYDAIVRLRANLILSTVADFRPHLILVDQKLLGLSNELAPARLMRMVGEELQPGCLRQKAVRSLDLDGQKQAGGWIDKLLAEPQPAVAPSVMLKQVFSATGGDIDHSVRTLLGGHHESANYFI